MRRFSTPVCIVLCLIFMIQSIAFAAELHPKPLQLSETQRKEFNTFFTAFVYLSPFERGQISDEEMIRFALSRIYRETGYGNLKRWDDLHWAASVQEVDEKAHKYFGKLVPTHRSIPEHILVEGYYVTGNASGEPSPFARLQDLYDNGDGTFTAVIWKYYGGDIDPEEIASIQPTLDADGSYTATFIWYDSDGTSRMWSDSVNLRAEYKATIKPIGEGSSKRYILLEYIKTREFS